LASALLKIRERNEGNMHTQKEKTGVSNGSARLRVNLAAGAGALITVLFGLFSKDEKIQFLSSFWASIIVVAWIDTILSHRNKS
jgi:hypothetical protein